MTRNRWISGIVVGAVLMLASFLISLIGVGGHHSKPMAKFYCYNVGSKKLTGGSDIACDAKASTATKGHKIESYEWDFGDPNATSKANTAPTNQSVATHTYHNKADYQVTLTVVETMTGKKSDPVSLQVTVMTLKAAAKPGTAANPKKVVLGDPGPGRCLPGPAILANLRKQKPGGQDFKAPYSAYELNTLTNAESVWVAGHESEACVIALAHSYHVPVQGFPAYLLDKHHLVLKEVGPHGLTVQNSYFNHVTGAIVWWQVQTFPHGELVWFSAKGTPEMKYVCGNRLRLVHVTKKATPHKLLKKRTPAHKTVTPKKPRKSVPMCVYRTHKSIPVPANGLCPKYDSSEPSTVPTQAQQHHPAADNSSEISRGPVKPTDSGNGIPSDGSPRSTPKVVATTPAPTSTSAVPAVLATPTASGTVGTHGP